MARILKSLVLCLLALLPAIARADDLDFAEKFADPATRTEALASLIPGTRDAYFHLARHQQLSGDTEGFNHTIDEWRAAASRARNPISSDGLETLTTRELLIRFEAPSWALFALVAAGMVTMGVLTAASVALTPWGPQAPRRKVT